MMTMLFKLRPKHITSARSHSTSNGSVNPKLYLGRRCNPKKDIAEFTKVNHLRWNFSLTWPFINLHMFVIKNLFTFRYLNQGTHLTLCYSVQIAPSYLLLPRPIKLPSFVGDDCLSQLANLLIWQHGNLSQSV